MNRRAALLATLLAGSTLACSTQQKPEPSQEPEPEAETAPAQPKATGRSPIAAQTRQLVVGISDDWDDATVELISYARAHGKPWVEVSRWPATIGHTGLAWGIGVHGEHAPSGRSGPVKVEGDGKSPAGAFHIGNAYGYSDKPPPGSRLLYKQVDNNWRCVDDPASTHYNSILDKSKIRVVDWSSAEHMKRSDDLYRWVVEIDHNGDEEAKQGSCIFFHVWGGPGDTTVGCAAMDRKRIESLMVWLNPDLNSIVVLLPRAEFDALREPWHLP